MSPFGSTCGGASKSSTYSRRKTTISAKRTFEKAAECVEHPSRWLRLHRPPQLRISTGGA
eukprot:scaffold2050_cov108-Alexandrium_tamarense.AAC.1